MHLESHCSINEIRKEWDSILPKGHHLCSDEIGFLEQCELDEVRFSYVFIRSESSAIEALAYFQLISFRKQHYRALFDRIWMLSGIERAVMRKGYKILCCGNSLRIDAPGLFVRDEKKIADVFSMLEQFYKKSFPKTHVVWMKDWQDRWSTHFMKQYSFSAWENDMSMKITISKSWSSLGDYENSLRHRYAQRFRRARKKKKELQVKELSTEEVKSLSGEIFRLYKNVVDRQPIRMVIGGELYFYQLKKNFREKCVILGYYSGQKLIGFSSILMKENLEELHLIGLDYAMNERTWLYFNMMFDALELAIKNKIIQVELGRTARQPKAAMGAEPVYFSNYIRINNFPVRFIVGMLRRMFNRTMSEGWSKIQAFKPELRE